MNHEQIIERLKQGNWYVRCQTKRESDLILQSCDEAGLEWSGGQKAVEFTPYNPYPLDIGFRGEEFGITYGTTYYKESGHENITDWFFNAIKNNDDNGKLTPQNAEQEHMVQILLAIMQKIPVEVNIGGEWRTSTILFPDMGYEYRIKPTPTPLPISREIWSHLDKRWQYAAMDEDGRIFFYNTKPTREFEDWSASSDMSDCPLNINAYGINWETSLTERPEDV